jgi:hypothetical protein
VLAAVSSQAIWSLLVIYGPIIEDCSRVQGQRWSITEEAARRWLTACSEQERGWVPD